MLMLMVTAMAMAMAMVNLQIAAAQINLQPSNCRIVHLHLTLFCSTVAKVNKSLQTSQLVSITKSLRCGPSTSRRAITITITITITPRLQYLQLLAFFSFFFSILISTSSSISTSALHSLSSIDTFHLLACFLLQIHSLSKSWCSSTPLPSYLFHINLPSPPPPSHQHPVQPPTSNLQPSTPTSTLLHITRYHPSLLPRLLIRSAVVSRSLITCGP